MVKPMETLKEARCSYIPQWFTVLGIRFHVRQEDRPAGRSSRGRGKPPVRIAKAFLARTRGMCGPGSTRAKALTEPLAARPGG